MKLIIVAATEREIEPFLMEFAYNTQGSIIKLDGVTAEVLVTGVGIANTAFAMGKRFANLESVIDLVINVGIAGSFNPSLEIGTVLNVTQDCLAFFGAEDGESFITADELNLVDKSEVVFENPELFQSSLIAALPTAKAISSNTGHGNVDSIERTMTIYHADIESMEGAAFTMACTKAALPHYQIRSISNKVERRNTDNWDIPLAVINLNKTLISLVNSFIHNP